MLRSSSRRRSSEDPAAARLNVCRVTRVAGSGTGDVAASSAAAAGGDGETGGVGRCSG